jgi:hypothetical protein
MRYGWVDGWMDMCMIDFWERGGEDSYVGRVMGWIADE